MNKAKSRSLDLFESDSLLEEEPDAAPRTKDRQPWTSDRDLARWAQEQPTGADEGAVRVAKFANGCRGVQIVRGKDAKWPAFCGSFILQPPEYMALARCVLRDSLLLRRLFESHPEGADEHVDKLRAFVNST